MFKRASGPRAAKGFVSAVPPRFRRGDGDARGCLSRRRRRARERRRSLRRRHTRSGRDSKEGARFKRCHLASRRRPGSLGPRARAAPGGERLGRAAGAGRGRAAARARRFRKDRVHDVRRDRAQQDARQAGVRAEQAEQADGRVSRGGGRDARDSADALDQRAGGKLGERVERALVERFAEEDGEGNAPGDGTASGASRSAAERRARSGTGRGSSYEGGFTAASLRALFSNENARKRNQTSSGLDDKTFAWLERASRGEDADPVVANVRDGAKSVTAFKSFKPVFEKARAHTWLKVLALELAERLAEDRRRFSRTPRTVRLEWRAEPNARAVPPRESFETRSKTFAFPPDASAALGSGNTPRAGEALTHAATRVFDALGPEATSPCTRVGLAASDFAPVPGARGGGIERFFVSDEKPRDSSRRTEETETNETRKNASLASVGAVRRRDLKKNANAALTPPPATPRGFLNRRRRFRNRQKAPRRTKCVWPREPTRSWRVPAAACGPPRGATRSRTRTSTSRLTCRRASRSTGAPGRARARREGKHIRREAGAARSAPGRERGRLETPPGPPP